MILQVSPYGIFDKRQEDGSIHKQVCDREAFDALVRLFNEEKTELLVDYMHDRGRAAGWITKLHINDDGLYADVRATPTAKREVNDEEFVYSSADWLVDKATGRPTRLLGVALTNTPNMPVVRIRNSKYFNIQNDNSGGVNSVSDAKPQPTKTKNMKSIALKLGLAEDADEAAIIAAIDALAAKVATSEEARLENEADAFVEKHKARIKNSAEIKKGYKQCPAAMIAAFEHTNAAANVRVTNSAAAKSDTEAGGTAAPGDNEAVRLQNSINLAKKWMGMQTSPTSNKFYNDNEAAITEGLNHIKE